MSIVINIDGVDKSSAVDWHNLRKTEVVTKQADVLEFLIKNYGTKTYQPDLNDEVVLLNGATKVFGGHIVEKSETVVGLAKYLRVIATDYTQILDRQLVSKTYQSMTVNAIIADLIATFTTGFTAVNVSCPITITNITFNYLTVSKCLEKITQVLGNYEWYVDYDKDVHFFPSASVASPFNITDTSANFVFGSLNIDTQTHQIRNEIIVRGGEVVSTTLRTEYIDGDGTKTQWPLANKFSETPTVVVNGNTKTVGIEFVDDDSLFQCMWDANAQSIRFTAGNTPIAGTRNVVVSGYPKYPLIVIKRNETSIALYGVFQYIVVDKTLNTTESALAVANSQIAQYSLPTQTGSFKTYTDGLVAGQTININSTIRNINQDFKIRQITTKFHTPTSFEYSVSLETSNDIGINDVLNKLLITNPADQIVVSADEVVQRYYGFTESMEIVDALSAPTKTSPPYVYDTAKWGLATYG